MTDHTLLMLLIAIPVAVTMALVISKIVQVFVGDGGKRQNLQVMENKIQELQQRVENLETIITSIDPDLLEGMMKIQHFNHPKTAQKQTQRLAGTASRQNDIPLDENFKIVLNKILMKIDSFLEDKKK
jgi:peptidoglycan hydrolase CwlO-like protein